MNSASRPLGFPRRRGFALIVTIVLVAFLVLVLVGLATFTRVETQVAGNSQHLAQARQNALMALNIAVGQLQKHTGPDQRVTATADLQPLATVANPDPYPTKDPASDESLVGDASDILPEIDDFWADRRNRRWTGAWANGNTSDYDRNNPAEFNAVPRLQSWLVSGNENSPTGDAYKPTDRLPALTHTSSPLTAIEDAAGRPHRILVKADAGVEAASDLDRVVTAPQVEIRAAAPGLPPDSEGKLPVIGHYAWWVGDEGVKTRANLDDPFFNVSGEEARLNRLQIAQRPAVEVIDAAFAPFDPTNHDDSTATLANFRAALGKVMTTPQLAYLSPTAIFADALKDRFHDITIWSRGVLADSRNGGLKADLTYVLSQSSLNNFRTALRGAFDDEIAPSSSHNPVINEATTIYAAPPANVPDATPYDGGDGILSAGTTWEQLWSFYNFSSGGSLGVFNASGKAESRRPTPTQHGLHPIVVQAKLFYSLRIVGGVADADGVNRDGIIHVDTRPQVVLANPYAVDLAPADYQVVITSAVRPQLRFGSTDSPDPDKVDAEFDERAYPGGDPAYNGAIRYVLKSAGIPAGEARVFTIDPDATDSPAGDQRIQLTGESDSRLIPMLPEYNPKPSLTFNTGKTIPPIPDAEPEKAKTRAALRSIAGQMNVALYMENDGPSPANHQRLVQYIRFQDYAHDLPANSFLLVDPIGNLGNLERRGGGYIAVISQPPTTDNPATTNPSRLFSHHQAIFSQINYRAVAATNTGSTAGGLQALVETGRTFSKNGSAGFNHELFAANLLFEGGPDSAVRWGLVNIGEGDEQTAEPNSIAGAGDVGFRNYLYDIPRKDRPIRSLGQLQHLSPSAYIPPGVSNFDSAGSAVRASIVVNSWQVNYPVSNSYPHPRVRREHVFGALPEHSYHYDGSFLWNQVLWDRFHFSTYPQSGSFSFAPGNPPLPNSRYRPFRDPGVVAWDDVTAFRGDGDPSNAVNSRLAARNLLLNGAFNINSTSVEAWKALFSSLRKVQVGSHTDTSAPFGRTLSSNSGTDSPGGRGRTEESWNGFRDLDDSEIQALAEEMVLEVRRRGPFLSLADFVNRRLVPGRTTTASTSNDPFGLGLAGALQAALDRTVNLTSHIHPNFRVQAKGFVREEGAKNNVNHNAMRDYDYRMPHALVGFPGHVLQADVLSSLGAALSARSDTFVIRTYGDSCNPVTEEVTGRAWCEAVVQRLPDYVDPSLDATGLPAAGSVNEKFGRRYQIVGFRWLGPEDI
jgi:Type II secretory pathway, component PulK